MIPERNTEREKILPPALPCPECRYAGHKGKARIGNRRGRCKTCNSFAQNVMRIAREQLKKNHQEEYSRLKLQVEIDLYPQVIEDWTGK